MELPSCAMLRRRGTVIVRIVDLCEICCKKDVRSWVEGSRVYCELCSCNGSLIQSSACDSARLRRRRTCRATSSSKVNVYAAAYLLLLVGGLSPTFAAPNRKGDSRNMAENTSQHLWENPCDYKEDVCVSKPKVGKYNPAMANIVAFEARNVFKNTALYQDQFASFTHSYNSLEALLGEWETYNWFRELPWFQEEMLPQLKTYNHNAPEEFVDGLMHTEKLNQLLPQLYKGLKLIVASFHAMSSVYKEERYVSLNEKLTETMHDMRYVLCQFQTLMIARDILSNVGDFDMKDIPDFAFRERDVLLVFRDSVNYVQYLAQVFQKIYEKNC